MPFPTTIYTDNASAGAGLTNTAAAAGLNVSGLQPLAQVQSVVANLLLAEPTTVNVPAGDVIAGTFGANKTGGAETGTYTFPGALVSTGALTINAASQLGTAAGTDVTTIGGTAYGAGAASLRMNGLTTAAVSNQTGTLTNAPSAGNPTFWMPINIAGSVRYLPCWS